MRFASCWPCLPTATTASKAFASWSLTTPGERQKALLKLADRFEEREAEFAALESLQAGKPMALAADSDSLDFHISPLLKSGGLSAQIRQSLNDLIRDTRGETIVKLRAFVAGSGDSQGLAWRILESEHQLHIAEMFAALIVLGVLGAGLNGLLTLAEASLLKTWRGR